MTSDTSERCVYIRSSDAIPTFPGYETAVFNTNVAKCLDRLGVYTPISTMLSTEDIESSRTFIDKVVYKIAGTDTIVGETFNAYSWVCGGSDVRVHVGYKNRSTAGVTVVRDPSHVIV